MAEKKRTITFQGQPMTLLGTPVKVGEPAPEFRVLNNALSAISFNSFKNKIFIISSVPSLDTAVCDRETRQFNEIATHLGEGIEVLTISMDLPFAQKRWCGSAHIDRVETYSDHRDASFGHNYGTLIQELRLLTRAVFVIDEEGIIRYAQYVDEITEEPDYDALLQAVRELVS